MIETIVLENSSRESILTILSPGSDKVAIELGVAEGFFSRKLLDSRRFLKVFGVDRYSDGHNTAEYKRAIKHIGLDCNYNLLRMEFAEALDVFPDNYFDFVYVDGYAHGGELGGTTIFSWFQKVKVGGILAGDDYHSDWPLVIRAVDSLVRQIGGPLYLTQVAKTNDPYSFYPSWGVEKKAAGLYAPPLDLINEGLAEERRVAQERLSDPM